MAGKTQRSIDGYLELRGISLDPSGGGPFDISPAIGRVISNLAALDGALTRLLKCTATGALWVKLETNSVVGDFNVANWPTSQPVTVDNWPTSQIVAVNNWPTSQPVTVGNWPLEQPVTVGNWPLEQPVTVGNWPSVQQVVVVDWPVLMPVDVSNWPADYPDATAAGALNSISLAAWDIAAYLGPWAGADLTAIKHSLAHIDYLLDLVTDPLYGVLKCRET